MSLLFHPPPPHPPLCENMKKVSMVGTFSQSVPTIDDPCENNTLEGAETHRALHRAHRACQRMQCFNAMHTLSEGRQGRGENTLKWETFVPASSPLLFAELWFGVIHRRILPQHLSACAGKTTRKASPLFGPPPVAPCW